MAHKKGVGSSRNGRDSQGKRLGVKAFGGQPVSAGPPRRLAACGRVARRRLGT